MEGLLKSYHSTNSLDIYKNRGKNVQSLAKYASARKLTIENIPEMSKEEYMEWYTNSKTKSEAEFVQFAQGKVGNTLNQWAAKFKQTFRMKTPIEMRGKAIGFFKNFDPSQQNDFLTVDLAHLIKEFAKRMCDDMTVSFAHLEDKEAEEEAKSVLSFPEKKDFEEIAKTLSTFALGSSEWKLTTGLIHSFKKVNYILCHWEKIDNAEIKANMSIAKTKPAKSEFQEEISISEAECPPPSEAKLEIITSEAKLDAAISEALSKKGETEEEMSSDDDEEGLAISDLDKYQLDSLFERKKELYARLSKSQLETLLGIYEDMKDAVGSEFQSSSEGKALSEDMLLNDAILKKYIELAQ